MFFKTENVLLKTETNHSLFSLEDYNVYTVHLVHSWTNLHKISYKKIILFETSWKMKKIVIYWRLYISNQQCADDSYNYTMLHLWILMIRYRDSISFSFTVIFLFNEFLKEKRKIIDYTKPIHKISQYFVRNILFNICIFSYYVLKRNLRTAFILNYQKTL